MFGEERLRFVLLSLPSMMWLALKGLRWRSYGKLEGQEEGETLDSRDTLMIGS